MPLSRKLKKQITDSFSKMKSSVEVMLFVSGKYPKVEKEMESALKDITALSRKLSLVKYGLKSATAKKYGVAKGPAIVLHGREKGRVRFFGFPSGYLFPIFVMDVLEISGAKQKVGKISAKKAESLGNRRIEVFEMPTEKFSPIASKIAHDVAIINQGVTADVIDALLFPELVKKYGITRVPTTVINGKRKMPGIIPFSRLVRILGK